MQASPGVMIVCAMLVACTNQAPPGPAPGPACGLAACGPAAILDLGTVGDPAALAGATITVCLDDRCATGPMPTIPSSCPSGTGVGNRLDSDIHAEVTVWCGPQGSQARDVSVRVDQVDGLADGDVYTVSLQAPDGTAVAQGRWVATYQVGYPNGSACGPACQYAQLSASVSAPR